MIKQIHLKGFGIHKDLTVQFVPGLNAVIGRNQHGKTNIMEAICFCLFGKTQNSTLDKVINFEMERATVDIETTDHKFSRTRAPNSSKLEHIEKLALEQGLGIGYPEFLSIFYISSHEQKSLFDPSYFRNFLISLFGLEVYAQKYDRLSAEYQGLQTAVQSFKKVNIPLIQGRITCLQAYIHRYTVDRLPYADRAVKCHTVLNQISSKSGEYRATLNQVLRKQNLIAQGKCGECGRPWDAEDLQTRKTKIDAIKVKIQTANRVLIAKNNEVIRVQQEVDERLNAYDYRIERARNVIYRLQEKARQQAPSINVARIKELELLMPIFKASGFPSYLLQVYVPVIVESANNLLQMMFPDMRVEIQTQRPESGKPDFKILIHKNDKVQEISDLCGAERVIVNLCFRLGIMIIFKQLNKTNIDFFLIDEGFERLDAENAIQVLTVFENFISLGYLKQVIIVTHKKELKELKNVNYIQL